MLRVGLSGGIGSGKSTVAQRFAEYGAVVIDADVIAREVVQPGTDGLAELVSLFGAEILDSEGGLDRPSMARKVFGDDAARAELNSIVHPRIGARTAELISEAPSDAIVVHDIPLLVEAGYAAEYHLVVIVNAPEQDRVRRLVARGLEEPDARARIQAQASEQQRRQAADVWLDNSGSVAGVLADVDELWTQRLIGFESNVRLHRHAAERSLKIVEYDPDWPDQAARLGARIGRAAGERALRVDHIGSTAVPGLAAKDVLDVQVTVRSLTDADALTEQLGAAGFPVVPEIRTDSVHPVAPEPAQWEKRLHASADPGRYANLHLRVAGRANWRYALLFRDWLRADPAAREEYLRVKRAAADQHALDGDDAGYAKTKEPWFAQAFSRAEQWASSTGWVAPEV